MSHYPHLFAPLPVGRHSLRNRVIFGSMHTRLETMDRSLEREAAFFAARAKGGAALVITAATSPNEEGRMEPDSHIFNTPAHAAEHRAITGAVHAHGALMLLQLHHAGRYAKHDLIVAPSPSRSPINRREPRELTEADIERTLEDFVRAAELAREAGYDGVEIMGSEGYLITQFTCPRANQRTDRWGGSLDNRVRFPVELVSRIRSRLGPDFLIMYRISALDLVEGGLTGDEIDHLARAVEAAGADILSTGVGWHEAPVPTITYHVPRGGWAFAVARLKRAVSIPVVASNRINTPEVAESLLADGTADLVALARPLLADPDFPAKAEAGRAAEINPCIACNQSCLDHLFGGKVVTCLVNPRAARELDFADLSPARRQKVAVVGSGPAGLSCAVEAARRGHEVHLFEAEAALGGQLNLARRIPGKFEFDGLVRYFAAQVAASGVNLHLATHVDAAMLAAGGYDRIVVASGIVPRRPDIPGIDHPMVAQYGEILRGEREAGRRVAIIGMGGIGYDTALYLLGGRREPDAASFHHEWGVDTKLAVPGGLVPGHDPETPRTIALFQRSDTRPGARLGLTTAWVLRAELKKHGVPEIGGCTYTRIDDDGLHYQIEGTDHLFPADTVVICAGQEPEQGLLGELRARGIAADAIGGARLAGELDAARAILEGTRLALAIGA